MGKLTKRQPKFHLGKARLQNIELQNKLHKEMDLYFETYDPVDFLSHITFPTITPKVETSMFNELPIVNFAVNVALKKPRNGKALASARVAGDLVAKIQNYSSSFLWQMGGEELYDSEIATLSFNATANYMIEQVNAQIYQYQLDEQEEKFFRKFEQPFNQAFGFKPSHIQQLSAHLLDLYSDRIGSKVEKIDLLEQTLIKKFEDPNEWRELQIEIGNNISKRQAISNKCTSELFYNLREVFIFELSDLNISSSDERQAILNCLNSLSIEFGKGNQNYNSFLDEDYSSIYPVIKISEGKFFVPLLRSLTFRQKQIEAILENEKSQKSPLWRTYEKARRDYSNELTAESLRKIFPNATLITNAFYDYKDKQREVDVIVKYDNKLLLCEVKAGGISYGSKSGKINKIKTDLKSLVGKAFEQTLSAKEYIYSISKAKFTNNNRQKVVFEVEHEQIKDVYCVCVTLENLQTVLGDPAIIRNTLSMGEHEFPWCVSLLELDVISKHIPSPSVFLHFLKQRQGASRESKILAPDELSYLAIYFEAGHFQMHQKDGEQPFKIFMDAAWVQKFDAHYLEGSAAPVLNIPIRFFKIIKEIEKSQIHNHSSIIGALLDIGWTGLVKADDLVGRSFALSVQDLKEHSVTMAFANNSIGLVYISNGDRSAIGPKLINMCAVKKYELKAKQWIGLGRDVKDNGFEVNDICFMEGEYTYDEELEKAVAKLHEYKKQKGIKDQKI